MPVGAGRLAPAGHAAELGSAVGVEGLAEDHVLGHDEAVDPGPVGGLRPFEEGLPAAGVVGGEGHEGGREAHQGSGAAAGRVSVPSTWTVRSAIRQPASVSR